MTRSRPLRAVAASAVVLVLLGAPGCGRRSAVEAAPAAGRIRQLPADLLPKEILGLAVQREDVGKDLQVDRPAYVQALGLYSMRKEDLVQATLQVGSFNADARARDASFRRAIILQLGGTTPQEVRIGDRQVFLTSSTKQTLGVWFDRRRFYVLAIRQEFARPRTLLRAVLDLEALR